MKHTPLLLLLIMILAAGAFITSLPHAVGPMYVLCIVSQVLNVLLMAQFYLRSVQND